MNRLFAAQNTELIYQRENTWLPQIGSWQAPGWTWWIITALFLCAAFVYVAIMYARDARGVGPLWASLLGFLRAGVFTVLAFIFMLPSFRDWKESESRSKIVVAFDTSGSMFTTIDDIPPDGVAFDKLLTRQDKVIQFLGDHRFIEQLQKNARNKQNPVDVFRFARGLDEGFWHFDQNRFWTRAELEEWQRKRDQPMPEPKSLPAEFWKGWLKPGVALQPPDDWNDADQARLQAILTDNEERVKKDPDWFGNTNVGDSALALLDSEGRKMLQGVVIFTDGRSTEGSLKGFEQLEEHARAAHVPIFVVGVGEERPQVRLDIVDVRAPTQIQPDDKFRVVAELTGEGLAEQEIKPELELTYTLKKENNKEELLDIFLVESLDPKDKDKPADRQKIKLGNRIILRPPEAPKFDKSTPPRLEIEYQLDAATLAAAAGVTLPDLPKGKKWEIAETVDKAEFRFRVRVPKDKREIFDGKEHVSDPVGMIVLKKPLRVLLFASAATHEYQFVKNMMVREVDKKRAQLAIYLQPPPGRTDMREGVVQDAPLLKHFPDSIDKKFAGDEEKLYDLSEYDVVVCFDPDWRQLTDDQIKIVKDWADKGGGLVLIGGPINTLELARPSGAAMDRLKPILELYPVILKDIRLDETIRDTNNPWPLKFEPSVSDMEFLKLAEETDKGPPEFLADWKAFFGHPENEPDPNVVTRGFYNFYPVDNAKPGAAVVARFTDPRAKLKDGALMPYLVLSNPADPDHRIVWIGWGETWRLRQYKESYHERFWTKLTRYAGGLNQGKVVKRITPNFGRVFAVNQTVNMEARIDDKGGKRLNENARPEVTIHPPIGLADKPREEMDKVKHMTYKPKSDGWFQVKFKPPVAGDYSMDIKVTETGDTYTHKFTVKPSNPELDNTRPDFDRMYQMASYADEEVLGRMQEPDRKALLDKLSKPKLEQGDLKDDRPRLYFDLKNAELIPNCMDEILNQRKDYSDPRPIWEVLVPVLRVPLGVGIPIAACLSIGFLVGFFFFRTERPGAGPGVLLQVLFGLLSLAGFLIGRHGGLGGWIFWVAALLILFVPYFIPFPVQLGWYAFGAVVGLLATEWLIRKLLRLA